MRGGGLHGADRAELLRDKGRRVPQVRRLDDDQQIVASAHEVAALHLLELRDAGGDAVEPAVPLGRDFDLDDRRDFFRVPFLAVDDRLVAENHALRLELGDRRFDLHKFHVEQARHVGAGHQCVLVQEINNRVHESPIMKTQSPLGKRRKSA